MYRFFHLEEKVCFTHWLPQGGRGYQRMYFEFRSWCHRSGSTWKNRSRQSSCPKSSCGAAVQADKFRLPLPSHFVQLVWGVGGILNCSQTSPDSKSLLSVVGLNPVASFRSDMCGTPHLGGHPNSMPQPPHLHQTRRWCSFAFQTRISSKQSGRELSTTMESRQYLYSCPAIIIPAWSDTIFFFALRHSTSFAQLSFVNNRHFYLQEKRHRFYSYFLDLIQSCSF